MKMFGGEWGLYREVGGEEGRVVERKRLKK